MIKYWYAVRISETHKSTNIKILSRKFKEKEDAEFHTRYEESLIKKKNKNHKYTIICTETEL